MKKGVELSMNVIIIAVICLIVLIVLVLIFSGRLGKFGEGVTQVEKSVDIEQCNIPGYRQCVDRGTDCIEQNVEGCGSNKCCLVSDI